MSAFIDEHIRLIFAGYFAFIVPYALLTYYRIKKWPWTEGELLHTEVGKVYGSGGSTNYFAKVRYKYWVNGEEFLGKRLSVNTFRGSSANVLIENQFKKIQYLPNEKIKVFYNPKKPRISFLLV